MHQTLFYIPYSLGGLPVFGFGLLFFTWTALLLVYALWTWRQGKWSGETTGTLVMALIVGAFLCWGVPLVGRPAGIAIQAYGAMMLLAILLAVGLAWLRAPKFGFVREHLLELGFWMCLVGIIGARLFYVVEYWSEIQAKTFWQTVGNVLNFPQGGLVVYGSLAGGLLGALVYLKIRHMPVLRTFDLLAPSMILGLAIGRIGCLLNGCCYGGVCDPAHLDCGVCFPAGSPPYMRQLDDKDIYLDIRDYYYGMQFAPKALPDGTEIRDVAPESEAWRHGVRPGDVILTLFEEKKPNPQQVMRALIVSPKLTGVVAMTLRRGEHSGTVVWSTTASAGPVSLPVYPTQIYSSLSAFGLAFLLLIYSCFRASRTRPGMKIDGEVIALMLTIYPIIRFLLETVRVDESSFLGTGFSISQNISFVTLATAAGMWVWIIRRKMPEKQRHEM